MWHCKSVYLLVYQRVLFYILILPGDVRLGLIIIVVGDKILHRILGKEFPELTAKLCGKGLVMRKHECRAIQRAITFAMVKVLPEPVTPSSVCARSPSSIPRTSLSIACG